MLYKVISLSSSIQPVNHLESALHKITLIIFATHILSWSLYLLSLGITGIYKAEQLFSDDKTINTENLDTLRNTVFTVSWQSLFALFLSITLSVLINQKYSNQK